MGCRADLGALEDFLGLVGDGPASVLRLREARLGSSGGVKLDMIRGRLVELGTGGSGVSIDEDYELSS